MGSLHKEQARTGSATAGYALPSVPQTNAIFYMVVHCAGSMVHEVRRQRMAYRDWRQAGDNELQITEWQGCGACIAGDRGIVQV